MDYEENKPEIFLEALLRCSKIGSATALKFLQKYNFSIEKCKDELKYILHNTAEFTRNIRIVKNELEDYKRSHVKVITAFDSDYPNRLLNIQKPILRLYYLGDINLLNKPSVAIVGTRQPNDVGIEDARLLTRAIALDFVIVSGMALGIDTIAHEETLKMHGATIAVLPSSITDIRPLSNKALSEQIVNSGGLLVTEYLPSDRITVYNYPNRNRIQAAIVDAVVVPAANDNSGTVNTLKEATKMKKPIFKSINCSCSFDARKVDPRSVESLQVIKDATLSSHARIHADASGTQQLRLL